MAYLVDPENLMIRSINRYTLDTDVRAYSDSIFHFDSQSYEIEKACGRAPQFQGEQYFWVRDNVFLGRVCNQAMLSSVNGKVLKISFRFQDEHPDTCAALREEMYKFVAATMGAHNQFQEISASQKIFFWQNSEGNVVMELNGYDTEIILTSSAIRYAKKISLFSRFFF